MAPRLEGHVQRRRPMRLGGGLRGAHVGAHRDVHADEASKAGQDGANGKANRGPLAEQQPGDHEDHHPDDADGRVLTVEIGLCAFAHGSGNFLHTGRAGVRGHQAARRHDAVHDGERACEHDQQSAVVMLNPCVHLRFPRAPLTESNRFIPALKVEKLCRIKALCAMTENRPANFCYRPKSGDFCLLKSYL